MMVLWTAGGSLNTARSYLGEWNSNFRFRIWWYYSSCNLPQKNIMEQLGQRWKFRNSKTSFSRSWNTNCRFRVWWLHDSSHSSHRRIHRTFFSNCNCENLDNFSINIYIILNDREEKYKELNTARRSLLK
jgi:hypothetical protein